MKKLIIILSFTLIAASFGFAAPPVANDDSAIVPEGGAVSTLDTGATSLLANDTVVDLPHDILTVNITPANGPSHGTLVLAANGEFTYTHDGSETTTDSFVYEINDGVATSTDTATVNITINPLNDAPFAEDDFAAVAEGGTVSMLDNGSTSLLDNDFDEEGNSLLVNITPVSGPGLGSVTLAANGTFTYIHDGTASATDSFVYEISDGMATATATVEITNLSFTVSFPDTALDGAIRAALEIPTDPLTVGDLRSLTSLTATDLGIADLTGLEAAINLEFLNLTGNEIVDLGPLSDLTALVDLLLADNQISDVSPLSGLTNLRRLELQSNQIRDIGPLSGLTGLEVIFVNGNLLQNIDALGGITNPVEVEVNNNFLIVSDGSSARLVIDALNAITANSVIYEPQNDLFAGLPLLDDLKDALEPIWSPLENDNAGVIDLVETAVGLSFTQNGPNVFLGVDLPIKGYAPVDRDWQAEVRSHIDPLALPSRMAPGPNFETVRVGFLLTNNSDPTDFLFSNGEVAYNTDGSTVSEDGPAVVVGGFTDNAFDEDFGRDFHSSTEVVLRLFWDSIAQTLTTVYVLEDGSVFELARVELGSRWQLQPGGTFTLSIEGFTSTDLVIAAETAYMIDFKADGLVLFQDTQLLDDLIDELDPTLWEFGTNSDNPGLFDLVETPVGFSFIQNGPRDIFFERLVTKQLNGSAPFDTDWSVSVDINLGNVDFSTSAIGDKISMEFTLVNNANSADNLFHSVNVLAEDDGAGNPVLGQRIEGSNFSSIFGFGGFNGVDGLRRTVSGDYFTLYLFWIAESQTLITAYEVDGVFSEAISSNLGSRWAMGAGDTFTLNLAGFTEANIEVGPEILFFNNFQASGITINPTGSVTVNLDPVDGEPVDGMQWRVNGQDWLPSGATVFGIDMGEALIEYRPVLGFDPLPSELIFVDENVDNVVDRQIFALAGTFGAFDPNFALPEFKRETGPLRVISDGNGGLLITWANFHNINHVRTGALIRVLESDGSLDANFNFGPQLFSTLASAVQVDGLILVSGSKGAPLADGSNRNRILRVFPDGSRDFSFASPVFNDGIRMLASQPDGKVLAGGTFTEVDGLPVSGFVRLNSDGSLD